MIPPSRGLLTFVHWNISRHSIIHELPCSSFCFMSTICMCTIWKQQQNDIAPTWRTNKLKRWHNTAALTSLICPTSINQNTSSQRKTKKKKKMNQTHLKIENLFKLGIVGFSLHLGLLHVRPARRQRGRRCHRTFITIIYAIKAVVYAGDDINCVRGLTLMVRVRTRRRRDHTGHLRSGGLGTPTLWRNTQTVNGLTRTHTL